MHISTVTVNCTMITKDRPEQSAYEICSIKLRF